MAEQILSHFRAGNGFPLVLLHPVGLDHSFWGHVVERCAATHQVIAFDLPGHGASPLIAGNRMADYVAALDASLRALGIDHMDLLGLSFGGMIAQELALLRPELVRKLVLSACGGAIPAAAREPVAARGAIAVEQGMGAVLQSTLDRWFTPAFMTDPVVARVSERLLTDRPDGWSAAWHAISGHDALSRLPGLKLEAMVVIGEKDLGTSVDMARTLAGAIPGARFVVVDGAPHMVQLECADVFADHVGRFLS